jgi:hypothetical protein
MMDVQLTNFTYPYLTYHNLCVKNTNKYHGLVVADVVVVVVKTDVQ